MLKLLRVYSRDLLEVFSPSARATTHRSTVTEREVTIPLQEQGGSMHETLLKYAYMQKQQMQDALLRQRKKVVC